VTVAFVDEHRKEFGVDFICRHPQVAPSSYYAAKKRQTAPSALAVRNAIMMQVLLALWITNRKVYGAHKLWKAARRAGLDMNCLRFRARPLMYRRSHNLPRNPQLWWHFVMLRSPTVNGSSATWAAPAMLTLSMTPLVL